MRIAVIILLYLVGIPLSVIIMSFVNRKMLDIVHRALYDEVIILALFWPVGLPLYLIISVIVKIDSESDSIERYLQEFIEGE